MDDSPLLHQLRADKINSVTYLMPQVMPDSDSRRVSEPELLNVLNQ